MVERASRRANTCDALGVNDSAVQVLGDATLRAIARDLVETVHRSVTIE